MRGVFAWLVMGLAGCTGGFHTIGGEDGGVDAGAGWGLRGRGGVWRRGLGGAGLPELMADKQDGPRKVAVDAVRVDWINGGSGEGRRRFVDGGTQGGVAIVTGELSPVEIALKAA